MKQYKLSIETDGEKPITLIIEEDNENDPLSTEQRVMHIRSGFRTLLRNFIEEHEKVEDQWEIASLIR